MSYDLLIKNGRIVDGSGLVSYIGDVAVKNGKIVAKGKLKDSAAKVIDATGLVVTPGFVDMHTHYDAQLDWDPFATPSCWHGVTTVVIGNCGFTLAPCQPRDREYLTQMFSAVEGVPLDVLQRGLGWAWEGFDQYLGHLDGKVGINVAANVGHSALRYNVMGPESLERQARPEEIASMSQVLHDCLLAGAFGFSTSLSRTHSDTKGRPIPSRQASDDEVLQLASVLAEFPRGGIEIIPRTLLDGFQAGDRQLMTNLSLVSGKQVNWNVLCQIPDQPSQWRDMLRFMESASMEGAQVYAISRCQRSDREFDLKMTTVFDVFPTWRQFVNMPTAKKHAALRDLAYRAQLIKELDDPDIYERQLRKIHLDQLIVLSTAQEQYRSLEGKTAGEVARAQGKHYGDVILDLAAAEDFGTQFALRGVVNNDEAAVEAIVKHPHSVIGISDGGAHLIYLCEAGYPTHFLSYWVRDKGVLSREDGIRRLPFMPA